MSVSKELQHGAREGRCRMPTANVRYMAFIILRNAVCAALVRILIGILKRLGKGGLRICVMRRFTKEIFSLDPLKWAFVFAGLSSFRPLKYVIMRLGWYLQVEETISSIFAGAFCSLPVMVMSRETQTDLSLYVFVRALHSFCTGYFLPLLPWPLRDFNHYDILIMCLSSSQILYSVVFAPFTMPPSYRQFLLKASMLDDRLIRSHAGLVRYQITPELVELCLENGYDFPKNSREHLRIGCVYVHPGMTCNRFCFFFLLRNMLRIGVPLYLPMKILTVLLFQRRDIVQKPFKMLGKTIISVLSSTLFLALYSASSIRVACFSAQGNIRGGLFSAITSSFAGIATLLEPKGRRMDLALYCLMYALRSFVLTQYRLGRLPYPRHFLLLLLYVFSVGFIYFQYDQQPDKMNSRMRGIIAKLCGEQFHPRKTQKVALEVAEVKQ